MLDRLVTHAIRWLYVALVCGVAYLVLVQGVLR